jgi:hypothetical protein
MQGQATVERADGQVLATMFGIQGKGTSRKPLPKADATKWSEQLRRLRHFESQMQVTDKYIDYCVKKYKPFAFSASVFEEEPIYGLLDFSENVTVPDGPFKGRVFWGQHQSGRSTLMLHGACILLDSQQHVLHLGSFKGGREHGPQRVMKAAPDMQRSFAQYNCVDGNLVGPIVVEKVGATEPVVLTTTFHPKRTNPALPNLKTQLQQLRKLESDIAGNDKYVQYCLKKYSMFKWELAMLDEDLKMARAEFKSNHQVTTGPFRG